MRSWFVGGEEHREVGDVLDLSPALEWDGLGEDLVEVLPLNSSLVSKVLAYVGQIPLTRILFLPYSIAKQRVRSACGPLDYGRWWTLGHRFGKARARSAGKYSNRGTRIRLGQAPPSL